MRPLRALAVTVLGYLWAFPKPCTDCGQPTERSTICRYCITCAVQHYAVAQSYKRQLYANQVSKERAAYASGASVPWRERPDSMGRPRMERAG